MAVCVICKNELSFIDRIKSIRTKCCTSCTSTLVQAKNYWLNTIEQAFHQGGVSQELEQSVYQEFRRLQMVDEIGSPVISRLKYLRHLSEIQWGNLPIIRVDIHLDSDEIAHFSMPVTYFKPNKTVTPIPGRFIGTNKKLYFLSNIGKGSMTLDWNNVTKVDAGRYNPQIRSASIHIQVAKGSGGGMYSVPDSMYCKVIIDTLVRLWKRQLVLYKEQSTHGAIPQHVKAAVFKRDGGKCVQCGYVGEYIEYDHIIPRSKGGPNTVDNVQLLCRKCNLRKGNRL